MARYQIYAPAYVRETPDAPECVHLGAGATLGSPAVIEVPDHVVPSVKWDALDEVALKNLNAQVEIKALMQGEGLPPEKAKPAVEGFRKRFQKKLLVAAPPKPEAKEINTNFEMAGQKTKVVGRASDKSPV
jgi:hypothetical protein